MRIAIFFGVPVGHLATWTLAMCLLCLPTTDVFSQSTEGSAQGASETAIEVPAETLAVDVAENPDAGWTDRFKGMSMPKFSMPNVQMPQMKMPEFSMPQVSMPEFKMPSMPWQSTSSESSAAVEQEATGPNPVSLAVGQVSEASKRAGEGVQSAWNSAISKLRPEPQSKSRIAKREEPGFWSRLFGPEEPSRGSETVTEFLVQERPGISR